jgi:hypothetical protein
MQGREMGIFDEQANGKKTGRGNLLILLYRVS